MRRVRALAAVLVLLAVLAGVPVLLAATIGNPAAGWPDLVAGDFSDTVLIDVLAAVAWAAWAQLTTAILLEALTALTRIRTPRRIPGVFAGQRQLARTLVVAAFMLTPLNPLSSATVPAGHAGPVPAAVSLTVSPAAASTTAPGPVTAPAPDRHGPEQTTTYLIRKDGPGTYWDLAETFLGNGQRWGEIWQLNRGRHQADGAVMTSPGLLRPGWTVLLPAGATIDRQAGHGEQVRVHRGDTLSGIAADHDVADWHKLWEANAGRAEPRGRRFTDPDLIIPGWTITISARSGAAPTPAPPPAAPAEPGPATSARTAGPSAPAPAPVVPQASTPGTSAPQASAPPTGTGAPSTDAAAGTAANPVPAANPDTPSRAGMGALAVAAFGAGGALLAGVSLAALLRSRRRAFRYRRPGRAIPATPSRLARTEKALLSAAGTADVTWLAQALRGLAQATAATPGARLPDVVAARLTPSGLELVLATAQPTSPGQWRVDPQGLRWWLERTAVTGFDPAAAGGVLAPYPTLASVGYTDGGDYWLLDLERVGALVLTGDTDRCLDLARFVAAELAHNTWADQVRVSLTGFGTELADLNPGRVEVVADPSSAVSAVAAHLATTGQVLAAHDVDVLDGRLRDVAADAWFPHVLLMTAPADATPDAPVERLLEQVRASRGRAAVAVVLAGAPAPAAQGARWQVHVDAGGQLQIPALELRLHAQQLPAEEAQALAQLLAVAARTGDEAMPAAGSNGWQAYADAAGAPRADLLTEPAPTEPEAHPTVVAAVGQGGGPDTARPDSVLPLSTQTYLDAAATTTDDMTALAPQVGHELRQQVNEADPSLDTDLAAWADQTCPQPKLRVLGPLAVTTTRGDLPADRPRRAWNTEVVAYLACHDRGVSVEQFSTDLWPGDPAIDTRSSKVRQALYVVRRWLGADPVTGADYLPPAAADGDGPQLYRIQKLLVDADLFRRLRLRGVARGADGISDLQAALDLVAGPPFADRRPGGYAWLADDPLDHTYTGMIVDVAHVVATHHLSTDRPDLAEHAAQVALRAGSSDDVALLDLLAAYDAQGRRGEADALVARIMANHDAEVEEDLPPRTAQVLHRRQWLSQAS